MKKTVTKKKKGITLNELKGAIGGKVEVIDLDKKYYASIKIFGKVFKSTGSTVKEALLNFKDVGKVGGICVLSMQKGDIKRDKILNSRQLFGLFQGSPTIREIALKRVSLLFDF